VSRNDAFTYVVDIGDVAPFCKLPAPEYWGKDSGKPGKDHWPPNLVNGRDHQWQQGFSLLLDEKQPMDWTMTLTFEITAWDAIGGANVVDVMNVWIKAQRPKKLARTVEPLLNTGVLVCYPNGKGGILLNQLAVPAGERDSYNIAPKRAILRTLLVNLVSAGK